MPGAYESIGIEEAADLGVIISALEIVERGLSIVDITTVAERIDITVGASRLNCVAVGVIFVIGGSASVDINQPNYIALQVGDVVVNSVVITGCIALLHGDGCDMSVL